MEKKVKEGDLVRLTDPVFEGQIVKVEKVFGKFVEYNEGLTNCYDTMSIVNVGRELVRTLLNKKVKLQ